MLDIARVNRKPCGVTNMIQTIQTYLHTTPARIWQKPWLFHTTKNFEWLGIQLAVENKDIFWNSIFSR